MIAKRLFCEFWLLWGAAVITGAVHAALVHIPITPFAAFVFLRGQSGRPLLAGLDLVRAGVDSCGLETGTEECSGELHACAAPAHANYLIGFSYTIDGRQEKTSGQTIDGLNPCFKARRRSPADGEEVCRGDLRSGTAQMDWYLRCGPSEGRCFKYRVEWYRCARTSGFPYHKGFDITSHCGKEDRQCWRCGK